MTESEPPKRRGRPRVSEKERKQHTMTFRMRSDLRDALEELAKANGRTLSDQVGYYVDSAVYSELELTYKYSMDALSPALFGYVRSRVSNQDLKEKILMKVNFSSDHREMLTIASKSCLNTRHTTGFLPWAQTPAGREGAVAMVRAMLSATRAGAIEALVAAVGSEAVEAAIAEEARARQPAPTQSDRVALKPDMAAQLPGGAPTLEEMQASFDQLFAGTQRSVCGHAAVEDDTTTGPEDFSIKSLKGHLARPAGSSLDLRSRLSSWPKKFSQLPGGTRAALIKALRNEAEATYETLMRSEPFPRKPGFPGSYSGYTDLHSAQIGAHRRMRMALLPRQDTDDDGPDEGDLDHAPEASARHRT